MAIEQLAADITASATVAAELYNTHLRSTQQVAQILYSTDPNLRSTQQVVQVLFIAHVVGPQSYETDITCTCTVGASLTIPKLSVNLIGSCVIGATITGTWILDAGINASATVEAELTKLVKLATAINASATVAVNLRENIEYLATAITASALVSAYLNVPWKPGNTLNLTQQLDLDAVLSKSLSHSLDLDDQLDLIFGQRFLSIDTTINLTHQLDVIRVHPTKTFSNTLALTHSLVPFRALNSYLNLQQVMTGQIFYLEGIISSSLSLGSTLTSNLVLNLPITSELDLTHELVVEQVKNLSIANSLNIQQNLTPVVFGSEKYFLLQAPFELIQTSMVLPNPLLDDSENLVSNLILHRSMNNTKRTYVKTSSNKRLHYTFRLTVMKALELKAFFNSYNGANIKILNWKGEMWKTKLITNPIDIVYNIKDRADVNLEFEGVLLNG